MCNILGYRLRTDGAPMLRIHSCTLCSNKSWLGLKESSAMLSFANEFKESGVELSSVGLDRLGFINSIINSLTDNRTLHLNH